MDENEIDFTELDDNMINALYSDALEASSAVLIAKCDSPEIVHTRAYTDNDGVKHYCFYYRTGCYHFNPTYDSYYRDYYYNYSCN